MSSLQRRKELALERAAAWEKEYIEEQRLAALSMYDKIAEAETISDIREILWEITSETD